MPSPAHQHHKLGLDLDGGSSSSACSSYEYSASGDHHQQQQLQHSLPHSRCCTPEGHTRGSPMSSSSSSMLLLRPTVVQLPPLHNNNTDDDDGGGGYWGTDCEEQPPSLPATITTTSPRLRKLSGWSATRPEDDDTETLESASVPLQWKPARRFYIKSVLWMVAMAMLTTQPNNNNKASMITRPEVPRFLKQRHSATKSAATSASLNVRHHEDWPRYEMPQAVVVPTKKRANVAFARSAPERPVYHTIPRFVLEEEDIVLPPQQEQSHNNPSVRFWIAGLVLGGMLADSLVREYHRWRAIQEEERAL